MLQSIKELVAEIRYERKVLEIMAEEDKKTTKAAVKEAKTALKVFNEITPIPCEVLEAVKIGGNLLKGREDAGWRLPEKAKEFDAKKPLTENKSPGKRGQKDANGFYLTSSGKIVRVWTTKTARRYTAATKHSEEVSNMTGVSQVAAESLPVLVKAILEKYKAWLVAQTTGQVIEENGEGEMVLVEGTSQASTGRRLAF